MDKIVCWWRSKVEYVFLNVNGIKWKFTLSKAHVLGEIRNMYLFGTYGLIHSGFQYSIQTIDVHGQD